jgi:imidazolonepropionase-like amidohydrolase
VSARAIRGATLIDGTGRDPVRNATVLIQDGRIISVGRDGQVSVPDGTEFIDADGRTLLPGMIDCHVHIMSQGFNIMRELSTPPSLALLQCIPHLRATLDAGFTTVRDAGGAPLGVKMAVEQGILPGPRMQISVTVLSQTGGHGDPFTRSCIHLAVPLPDVPGGVVDGIEPMRQRVREILRAGADWIKICTTGGVLSQTDAPSASQFTVAEIETAVYEAQADGGKQCMAHAQGTQGIKNAITAGVKSIEHGIWLDEEAIELMKQRDIFLVPTLVAPLQVIRQSERDGGAMPPWGVQKARAVAKDHAQSFRQAHEAGVKIAMGTDSGVGPHGENAEELELMVDHGMTAMDAIVSSTSRAATLLGVQDQFGTIESGKIADVLLVDGNPLDTIGILRDTTKITMVMKDGQVFKDVTQNIENTDLLEATQA